MNLSDVSHQILVSLFAVLASTVRVQPLVVVILADQHGLQEHLGRWIPEMCGPNNLFTVHIVCARALTLLQNFVKMQAEVHFF